jgi:predicted enzyme related to lactoylglutathione lyase
MQNPFSWVEIYVNDMVRAKNFYEAVFGVQLEDMTMPDSVEDTMQMFSFPSDMQGF